MKYTITAAVLALLAAQEVTAFGVNKNAQRAFSRASAPESLTQLFAEGSQITMPALSSTMKEAL